MLAFLTAKQMLTAVAKKLSKIVYISKSLIFSCVPNFKSIGGV